MNAAPTTPVLANDAQRGSHWQQRMVGRHSWALLINADCLEVLPEIACDVVISDPPYGIALSNNDVDGHRREAEYTLLGDECQTVGNSMLEWAERMQLPTVVFSSPWKPWPGKWRNLIAWDKGGAVGGGGDIKTCLKRTWELVQVARNNPLQGRRDESVWRIPATPQDSKHHICAKPVKLMAALVEQFSAVGQTVCDPFMGSGSTGVAACRLHRNFIGIERDAAHYKTACDRIAHELDGALL
jgi:site-specific DNA-methyltransferase (adenine-specific)